MPNITAYHGAFQTREEICIVMEYCPCGDLLERLLAEGRAFEEARVAEVAATLLSTLQVPAVILPGQISKLCQCLAIP